MDGSEMKNYGDTDHDTSEAVFTDKDDGTVEILCYNLTKRRQVSFEFGYQAECYAITIDENMVRVVHVLHRHFGPAMIGLLGWLVGDVDLADFERMT